MRLKTRLGDAVIYEGKEEIDRNGDRAVVASVCPKGSILIRFEDEHTLLVHPDDVTIVGDKRFEV